MASLRDLLAALAPDARLRGRQFEAMCKWFLETSPDYERLLRRVCGCGANGQREELHTAARHRYSRTDCPTKLPAPAVSGIDDCADDEGSIGEISQASVGPAERGFLQVALFVDKQV